MYFPSSIHEVLLVADDGSVALTHLEQMVRDINEAEVAPGGPAFRQRVSL